MKLGRLSAIAGLVIVAALGWRWVVTPRLLETSDNFTYSAGIESVDNFFDENKGDFKGEERTVTKFSYEVVDMPTQDVLEIKNGYDVRTVYGDPVFSVERVYGMDRTTGNHVPGYGDKDRDGYLFAPRGIKKGEGYTYWHINYDAPAQMEFVGEDMIEGVRTFHYQSIGLAADQTENLTFLPHVGETRGVRLAVDLETWIEPVSGYLVKYEDHTLAKFYNLDTGEVIHPWNKFRNQYSASSIRRHAQLANQSQSELGWLPSSDE